MRPLRSDGRYVAVLLSLSLHVLVLVLAGGHQSRLASKLEIRKPEESVIFLEMPPAPPVKMRPAPPAPPAAPQSFAETTVAPPVTDRQPTSMDAPPAPTAQDWALAGQYTLKNSKRYRYTWGQQVRSMMGTAVEGPDQGLVRFRIEIAPDGTLARLETLWSTSAVAEKLAHRAVENMPRLPPTPTGQPLIFEKTISFQPFETDGPPIYKNDCLPDPPAFRNPFAWDGKSPQVPAASSAAERLDPQALEECRRQLLQDSVEAEGAHDRRQLEQWRSNRLGR